MACLEGRRVELGLSMDKVNDLAGAADRYYAKMVYPDAPSGRQGRWETVDEFMVALFGSDYTINIVPGDMKLITLSAVSEPRHASFQSINIRHWRHSRHFKDLGKKGGDARAAKLSPERRLAIAKKANRAWKRSRKARLQGAKHLAANSTPKCEAP